MVTAATWSLVAELLSLEVEVYWSLALLALDVFEAVIAFMIFS